MSAAPTQTGAVHVAMGCGPAREIILGVKASDDSALFARLTRSGGRTTYMFPIGVEGRVAVGHSMCHGAFYFRTESSFEVEVEVVDVAGNVAVDKSVITVTPPKR